MWLSLHITPVIFDGYVFKVSFKSWIVYTGQEQVVVVVVVSCLFPQTLGGLQIK